jgi:hypothetical protein
MSHAFLAHNNRITNPAALKIACERLGLRIETAAQAQARKGLPYTPKSKEHPACGQYDSYRTVHGRWVGDYPTPPGMHPAEVSFNADFVISLSPDKLAELRTARKVYTDKPWEVGIVWLDEQDFVDPVSKETVHITAGYYPVHDFWAGGQGIEEVVGKTKSTYVNGKQQITESHGLLMQMYRMVQMELAAQAVGDEVERVKLPDGSYVDRKKQRV